MPTGNGRSGPPLFHPNGQRASHDVRARVVKRGRSRHRPCPSPVAGSPAARQPAGPSPAGPVGTSSACFPLESLSRG
eukprot:351762-Chlamydomonas_euryale.AAC.7